MSIRPVIQIIRSKQQAIGHYDPEQNKIYINSNLLPNSLSYTITKPLEKPTAINGMTGKYCGIDITKLATFTDLLKDVFEQSTSATCSATKNTFSPGTVFMPTGDKSKIQLLFTGLNDFAQTIATQKYTELPLALHTETTAFIDDLKKRLDAYINNLLINSPANPAAFRNSLFSHTTDKPSQTGTTAKIEKIERMQAIKATLSAELTIQQLIDLLDTNYTDNEVLHRRRFLGLKKPNAIKTLEKAHKDLATILWSLRFEIAFSDTTESQYKKSTRDEIEGGFGESIDLSSTPSSDNGEDEELVMNPILFYGTA